MSLNFSAIDLVYGTDIYSLAINLIIISIFLSAFALGISRALKSRKLWAFGVEELMQAIINAVFLGAIISTTLLSSSIVSSSLPTSATDICPQVQNSQNGAIIYSICVLDNSVNELENISSLLIDSSFRLGFLASMRINTNVVSVSPFDSFSSIASTYLDFSKQLAYLDSFLQMQKQFLYTIYSLAFSLFLPIGLLFRMFFATRKFGGAIMATAIGFFLLYPLAYSSLIWKNSSNNTYEYSINSLNEINSVLGYLPLVDWGKSNELSNFLMNISGSHLSQKVALPYSSISSFIANLMLITFIYPLFSLVITLVAIFELSRLLGSEFRLDIFEMI